MTNASAAPASVRPNPPRFVRYAVAAIVLQVVLTLITMALLWGYTSQLTKLLINSNAKLKTTDKNRRPVDTYVPGSAQIVKDLHDYRFNITLHSLIVCGLFAFAAYAIWRGLGLARWLYMAAAILFSISGVAALGAEGPTLTNAMSFVVAVAAIAAIILLLLPQSAQYFIATKARRMPPSRLGAAGAGAPGANGGPRPGGFRALFGPPLPREPRPGPIRSSGGRTPASTRPVTRAAGAPSVAEDGSSGRGKPKVRTSGLPADTEAAGQSSAVNAGTAGPRGRGKSRRVSS